MYRLEGGYCQMGLHLHRLIRLRCVLQCVPRQEQLASDSLIRGYISIFGVQIKTLRPTLGFTPRLQMPHVAQDSECT
jgi:hypothetical protein